MAEVLVARQSIFMSAWFWLLMIAILFFIVGIILLALVGTGWGVLLILLGVLFLIVAGVTGFISSSRQTAVELLNTPAGAQLIGAAVGGGQGQLVQGQVAQVVQAPMVQGQVAQVVQQPMAQVVQAPVIQNRVVATPVGTLSPVVRSPPQNSLAKLALASAINNGSVNTGMIGGF